MTDRALRGFSGYVMKRAFNAIRDDVNAALAPLGLRMLSFSALALIADNPARRQSQLADALGMERPNVVGLVDELEQAGLITRAPCPTDRRANALNTTEAGKQLYARARREVEDHEARMTAELTAEERSAFLNALRAVETSKGKTEHHDEYGEIPPP